MAGVLQEPHRVRPVSERENGTAGARFTFGGSALLVPTRLLHLELRNSQLGRSKIVFEINVGGAGNHIDDGPFFETFAVFLFGMCNLGMWEGRAVLLDELFYGVDIAFPCLASLPSIWARNP